MRRYWWVGIGFLPLAYWGVQMWMLDHYSNVEGCIVNEGFAHGCIWDGNDIGQWLYGLGISVSWGFIFFTLPITVVWTLFVLGVMFYRAVR